MHALLTLLNFVRVIAVNVRVIYIYGMGVHMRIIGMHTCASKIRVRRAKVCARGRPALLR